MMDHDSKVALAKMIQDAWNLYQNSWIKGTDRYKKSWSECIEEATKKDPELYGIISVCVYFYGDVEDFVKKYTEPGL